MLVIDPEHRISVDEALKHPYVHVWFDENEVYAPPPEQYNHTIDTQDHTVDQWKGTIDGGSFEKVPYTTPSELIFHEIMDYEQSHDVYGYRNRSTTDAVDSATGGSGSTTVPDGSSRDGSTRVTNGL
jgi:hypothetical protein